METDRFGRTLPLAGHRSDCPHGRTGWAYCICDQEPIVRGAYVASRASNPERPAMWLRLRAAGFPIVATWIDEAAPGVSDFCDLWQRVVREVTTAERLVLYVEPGDFPLKGAFVEVGIALGAGVPVLVVAPDVPDALLGSWLAHPLVRRCATVEEAFAATVTP